MDALLADGDTVPGLSIVAIRSDEVVGHVVCCRRHIESKPALGLGPLGVLPKYQRHGVGSALMHGALAAADALGEPCVAILGDARYYSRFGFEPAARLGVLQENPAWAEHFQLRRLTAWHGSLSGVFHYAEALHRV